MCNALDKRNQRDFVRWMMKHGYKMIRQKGSHMVYMNQDINHSVVISIHLNRMVMERIKKEIMKKLVSKGYCKR